MRRARCMVAVALLATLLLSSCGEAAKQAEVAAPEEETMEAMATEQDPEELFPFQDFPSEANSADTKTAKSGEVREAELQTDLFQAKFEGDTVSGSGGAVGGAFRFIATETDGESWHVKLECNYPTVAGRDYHVTYTFNSDVAGTVKFGDFQEFPISVGENSVTGVFTAKESSSYLDLQLGMLQPFTIDFTKVEVKEYADEVDYEDALPKPVNFERESRVYENHDQGYDIILVRRSHAINVNCDGIPIDTGVWKSRLYVRTGVVPEPGEHYRVTADVMSTDRDIPYELLINDGQVEKGYGALYGQTMKANEVTTCEAVITGNGNGDELILQFSLGENRAGNTVVVGNVHVDKVIDYYTDELPEDYALNKSVATGAIIDELVPVAYRDIPLSPSFYSGVESVYEQHDDGYIVDLEEGKSSAVFDILKAPSNPDDRGVWKAKLYAATGVSLRPGQDYRIRFDLDSERNQSEYEVVFDGDSENAYGALYGRSLKAGETDHIDTLIKPTTNGGPLTVRIQLGKTNTASGNTVTLRNFIVEAVDLAYKNILPAAFSYKTDISQSKFVNVLPRDFTYDTGVNVFEQHDDGYTQSVSADGDSATLNIKSARKSGRDIWNSKLIIRTGFTPKVGQKYIVSYDIEADKDQKDYEICYDGATDDAYGKYGHSLTGGSKETVSHSFTPKNGHGPLVLRLQLGKTDDASGNVIKVSNIQIKAVTSTATDLGDIDYTTGFNVWEQHGDGIEQSLTTTDSTAALKVTEGRSGDGSGVWSSLLFIKTGVKPEAGKRYRVISTVASEKAIGDFEVLCDNGDTEGGYGNSKGLSVDAGGTTTVTTDFTAPESGCNNLTLRYQLGNSPADNTVTVSDIQVCELTKTKPTEVKLTDFAYPLTTEPGLHKNSFDLKLEKGAEAELTGDGASYATAKVTKPGDDWHVKLYVQPKYKIEEGETYTVSMDVSGADGRRVDFKNANDANGEGEDGFGTATISDGKLTHTFMAGQTGDIEAVLRVGNVEAGTDVTVSNFKITKSTEDFFPSEFSTTYPKVKPAENKPGTFYLWTDSDTEAKLGGDGASYATATVTKPGADWKVKLYVQPGLTIEAGKQYRVSMDVENANDCQATFKNTSSDVEDSFGTATISGGKLTHTFTADQTGVMEVVLKVGNVAANTEVKVSNVKVEKLVDKDEDITPGSISYDYWTGEGAAATRDGQSITVVESTGEDWHIKFYVQPGLTIETGKQYKVSMDVENADGCEATFKNTNTGVEEAFGTVTISGGKLTHTITAEETGKMEVVLKLGKLANGTKVTVSNVKIAVVTKGYDALELSGFEYPLVVPESVEPGTFYLWTDSDTEAKLGGDGASYATATVTKPGADWKVKLYVQPGLTIEAGKQYKVNMDVENADGCEATFKNTNTGVEEAFGTATISDGKLTHTFTAGETGTMEVVLKVGNVDAGTEVKVSNIEISEYKKGDKDVTPEDFAYTEYSDGGTKPNSFFLETNSGADATLTGDGKTYAKATVTKPGVNWNVKLYAQPKDGEEALKLKAGETYKVSMDVENANGCEVCLKNPSVDNGEDFFGTTKVSDGKVAYTFTPVADGPLEVLLKIGNVAANTEVIVKNFKIEQMEEEAGDNLMTDTLCSWAPVNFWAHDDYAATLTNDDSSARLTINKAPDDDEIRESWKTKLFVETGFKLEAGKTYRISADVKASEEFPYEICYNNGPTENGVGALHDLTATKAIQTETFEVTPDSEKDLIIQFSVGKAKKDTTVTVSNIKVEELDEKTGKNLMTDALKAWAPIHEWVEAGVEDGYKATLTNNSSSATMKFFSVPSDKADWKAKLFVETGAKLKAGKSYRIRYKLKADKSFKYNLFYNNGSEEKAVGEFYDLTAGRTKLVEHVVTPAKDAELTMQLMLGMTRASNNVRISGIEVEEITDGAYVPISAWAHDGYVTKLSNTKKSASLKIKKVPAKGREAWKVKLFADTGAELKAGKAYRISVDVKATKPLTYDLCYNNEGDEAAFGAKWALQATTGNQTIRYNVTPDKNGKLVLQLNLGNATGPNTVTISKVKVEEIKYVSSKSITPNFRYDTVGYLSKASDPDYITSLDKRSSSATFRIKKAPAERHAWCAKVNVDTHINPKDGMGYRITFDVDAAKSQKLFEVFFDGKDELAYGALYEQVLNSGRNTFTYTIMPGENKGPLKLQLRFGETDDTSGNAYTILNFKMEEVDFVQARNPEIKQAVENDTQDGYVTELTKSPDMAMIRLVDTPEEGLEAWKNKVFVYTGVVLQPGQRYRIRLNVGSIIPAPFEICFNNHDVEKGLGGIFGLTSLPEGKYIEYYPVVKEETVLVVQLSLGNCVAPNTFFLSDVKVEKADEVNLVSDTIYTF